MPQYSMQKQKYFTQYSRYTCRDTIISFHLKNLTTLTIWNWVLWWSGQLPLIPKEQKSTKKCKISKQYSCYSCRWPHHNISPPTLSTLTLWSWALWLSGQLFDFPKVPKINLVEWNFYTILKTQLWVKPFYNFTSRSWALSPSAFEQYDGAFNYLLSHIPNNQL